MLVGDCTTKFMLSVASLSCKISVCTGLCVRKVKVRLLLTFKRFFKDEVGGAWVAKVEFVRNRCVPER